MARGKMMAITLDGKKAALVAVDIQNKFYTVTEGLHESVDRRIGMMNSALDLFHDTGSPVILVCYDPMNLCTSDLMDDPEAFVDGLRVRDSDARVHKDVMNSFHGTDLAERIREAGAECIVLMGLVAHICVLSTYFGAIDAGFTPYILRGALSATDESCVGHVEAICRTVDIDALRQAS